MLLRSRGDISIITWVSRALSDSFQYLITAQVTISTRIRKCATRARSDLNISSVSRHPYLPSYRRLTSADPESLDWNPLDGELSTKLNDRPYVSLSRDRTLAAQGISESGNVVDDNLNDEEVSLFDLHMPGVLTVEEVEALLDHWVLLVRGAFVHMAVGSIISPSGI